VPKRSESASWKVRDVCKGLFVIAADLRVFEGASFCAVYPSLGNAGLSEEVKRFSGIPWSFNRNWHVGSKKS
jgi:hypothetical protein